MKTNVDTVIEKLVATTFGNDRTERERYLFSEALRNLVRLARTEQILEIKTNVKKLTGAITANATRRKEKIDRLLQGANVLEYRQREFEFDQRTESQAIPHLVNKHGKQSGH